MTTVVLPAQSSQVAILEEKRLRAQAAAIDKLNASLSDFRVLKGTEVDILEDGSLDFDNKTLAVTRKQR